MRTRRNTGFSVLAFAAIAIPLTAIVGLAIDTGMLYLIKSKLSAAVDAGALAGARALSRGLNDTQQKDRASEVAVGYVKANFAAGYMMSRNLNVPDPTIDSTVVNQRSVILTANVEAPTMFLKIVHAGRPVVQASATAVRVDVNVVMVLDRSGSLENSGSCDDMIAAARGFVAKFAPTRDFVGLVTFASSSFTEFPIAGNFATAATTLDTRISRIVCHGATSSADGLSRGYVDLAAIAPRALNVILFFTDGQPTATAADFPKPVGTTCTQQQLAPTPAGSIRGVFTYGGTQVWGLLSSSVGYSPVPNDFQGAPMSTGCRFMPIEPSNHTNTDDYRWVPNTDIWGNNHLSGYPYATSSIARTTVSGQLRIDKVAANAQRIAENATIDAAFRIRTGAVIGGRSLPNVVIFGIGLSNAAGLALSQDLMLRVTNDPRAPGFPFVNQRQGLYIVAPTAADLEDAFTRIASEILRLSQ